MTVKIKGEVVPYFLDAGADPASAATT